MLKIIKKKSEIEEKKGLSKREENWIVENIGEIGKIVSEIGEKEKMVEKGRIIGREEGSIELKKVGSVENIKNEEDRMKRIIKLKGLIFVSWSVVENGMGKEKSILKIVISKLKKIGKSVLEKKGRSSEKVSWIKGKGIEEVLKKLKRREMLGIKKWKKGKIEKIRMIGFKKRKGERKRWKDGKKLMEKDFKRKK